jgi:ubiquinone/menaquinone biosynthesis C-methylase UbiE
MENQSAINLEAQGQIKKSWNLFAEAYSNYIQISML